MTCCGDLEHNQAFLVQTFFAQSHKPEQHTKLRGPNHQICGPKSSIVSHVKTVQIAGVKSNFTGSKNEVWVQISNLQNCGGTNPILRRQKMRHGSRFQICVGPKVQNCPVWGPKIVQFASGQNLQFANNQIRRVKKRQKMRSPGIEPGSITWQATIITTRPRAQLRT